MATMNPPARHQIPNPSEMSKPYTIAIVSDIHYACALEQARGEHELRVIRNPLLRAMTWAFRHFIWMSKPLENNPLVDQFIARCQGADLVVANGDYSCDSANVGVSDDAACQSVRECLDKFRTPFGDRFLAAVGDHELGKMSLFGGVGGPRLASWERMQHELRLEPVWSRTVGNYVLIGVVSSLIDLPVYEPETLPGERTRWRELRELHLARLRELLAALQPGQRVVLFCHDPTALPWLWREELMRAHIDQIEMTVIGHLHSGLIFWKSRLLAGMPAIRFLGNAIRRMSSALNEARHWRLFKVKLCPALAGIQLLNDGGYALLELDLTAQQPARFTKVSLPRRPD